MAYSPSEIYQALIGAGIPSYDAGTLTQISGAESGYGANPVGPVNRNNTQDFGVFQINSGAWPQLNPSSLVNASLATQAAAAATVYQQQGLGAWATYNSGAYQKYASGAGDVTATPTSSPSLSWTDWLLHGYPDAQPGAGTGTGGWNGQGAGSALPGGGGAGSLGPAIAGAATGASGVFDKFTSWLGSIAARAGLFVLALLFIAGAVVLFGIKSGIDIETGPQS